MFVTELWESGWDLLGSVALAVAILGGLLFLARRVNANSGPPTGVAGGETPGEDKETAGLATRDLAQTSGDPKID